MHSERKKNLAGEDKKEQGEDSCKICLLQTCFQVVLQASKGTGRITVFSLRGRWDIGFAQQFALVFLVGE